MQQITRITANKLGVKPNRDGFYFSKRKDISLALVNEIIQETVIDMKIDEKTFRLINQKGYTITVDNSKAGAHNVNIDYPTFFAFALSEEEAIGKMMRSDFTHKAKEIISISHL